MAPSKREKTSDYFDFRRVRSPAIPISVLQNRNASYAGLYTTERMNFHSWNNRLSVIEITEGCLDRPAPTEPIVRLSFFILQRAFTRHRRATGMAISRVRNPPRAAITIQVSTIASDAPTHPINEISTASNRGDAMREASVRSTPCPPAQLRSRSPLHAPRPVRSSTSASLAHSAQAP